MLLDICEVQNINSQAIVISCLRYVEQVIICKVLIYRMIRIALYVYVRKTGVFRGLRIWRVNSASVPDIV